MLISEFKPEIDAIQKEGYRIVGNIDLDYGRTLGLQIEKDGEEKCLMLYECFYDTDKSGNRTKWHGTVDIRSSLWGKRIRGLKE